MWCCYITDEEINDTIFENLVQNGGNISIVNDSLLDLCNRIAIAYGIRKILYTMGARRKH
jgi:hypothetical protein